MAGPPAPHGRPRSPAWRAPRSRAGPRGFTNALPNASASEGPMGSPTSRGVRRRRRPPGPARPPERRGYRDGEATGTARLPGWRGHRDGVSSLRSRQPSRQVVRPPGRSWRPAPTRPSTSAATMICSTASATGRRAVVPALRGLLGQGRCALASGPSLGARVRRQAPPRPTTPVATALDAAGDGECPTPGRTLGAPLGAPRRHHRGRYPAAGRRGRGAPACADGQPGLCSQRAKPSSAPPERRPGPGVEFRTLDAREGESHDGGAGLDGSPALGDLAPHGGC